MNAIIAEKLKMLPEKPGVYIMRDENDAVIAETTLHKGMRTDTLVASTPVEPGRAYRLVYTYSTYKGELLYSVQTIADVTRG